MIEVDRLSKRYGQVTAVEGLSFTVPDGAITGFLGPNGAGKSTTMRCLLGLHRPTTGTVLIDGRPLTSHSRPADIYFCEKDRDNLSYISVEYTVFRLVD